MGVINKFRDLVGIGDEFDEEDDYISEEEIEEAERNIEAKHAEKNRFARNSYSREGNVVKMSDYAAASMKVLIIEPKTLDESAKLVDSLKEGKPLIINLNGSDRGEARKIFDFLSGATYALNGNVQTISDNIFIFAPDNVNVSASGSTSGDLDFADIDVDSWR